jgi:hypothetical protein
MNYKKNHSGEKMELLINIFGGRNPFSKQARTACDPRNTQQDVCLSACYGKINYSDKKISGRDKRGSFSRKRP